MSALEKFTNFILSNPVSKAVGSALEKATELVIYSPLQRDMLRLTKVLHATQNGDLGYVEKALKKEGNNDYVNDPVIKMLMHEASANGHEKIVQMLLNKGALAEGSGKDIEYAEAALKGNHIATVEVLYNHVNAKGMQPSDRLKNAFSQAQALRSQKQESNDLGQGKTQSSNTTPENTAPDKPTSKKM